METLTKSETLLRKEEVMQRIYEGEVFIHPTDTIYGLGCNALDEKAVQKIRKLKERQDAPFLVWAPSKSWVLKNCVVDEDAMGWLEQLPGPITLVLKLKNSKAVAKCVGDGVSLGVRLPNHWLQPVLGELGLPIVTTSANKTGKMFMTSIENLDPDIKKGVRFMIYEGEKNGKPSKIVNLVENKVKVR